MGARSARERLSTGRLGTLGLFVASIGVFVSSAMLGSPRCFVNDARLRLEWLRYSLASDHHVMPTREGCSPSDPDVVWMKGLAAERLAGGDPMAGLPAWRAASSSAASRLAARAQGVADRHQEAAKLLRASLSLVPNNAEVRRLWFGQAQTSHDEWPDLARDVDGWLAQAPSEGGWHAIRAYIGYRNGEPTVATESRFEEALRRSPDDLDVLRYVSGYRLSTGSPAKLIEPLLIRGYRLAPNDPEFYYSLGLLYMREGRLTEAVPLIERLARERATDPYALAVVGSLYSRIGRTEAAVTTYRRVLGLDDRPPGFHMGLGDVLSAAGHRDEAILAYCGAVARDPASPARDRLTALKAAPASCGPVAR
jgi:tetratricopeptide (TPR) repeat protein